MGYDFELGGLASLVHPTFDLESPRAPGTIALSIDGRRVEAALIPGSQRCEYFLDVHPDLDGIGGINPRGELDRRERVFVACDGDLVFVHLRGRTHRVEAINALVEAQKDAAPSGGDDALLAPMPGVVVDVAVTVGAEVEAGALLLTIESMKLQTAIVAPTAGRVVELGLSAGSSFEQGAVLVRLEGLDTPAGESQ